MSVETIELSDELRLAWREYRDRGELSTHDTVGRVVEGARAHDTIRMAAHEARIRGRKFKSALTWLGLATRASDAADVFGNPRDHCGGAVVFPPEDLDRRLDTIEAGDLPADAEARVVMDELALGAYAGVADDNGGEA